MLLWFPAGRAVVLSMCLFSEGLPDCGKKRLPANKLLDVQWNFLPVSWGKIKANVNKSFMISTWLLKIAFLIYPILVFKLNSLVRRKIPEKAKRQEFKKRKEYIIKVVYLLTPLLLFHLELLYLNAGYSFSDINLVSLIVLFLLQLFLLYNAVVSLYQLFAELKNYK